MRLLIFDFDGVIADTFADMLKFAQETCDEFGVLHTVIPSDLRELEVMSFTTLGRACEVPEMLTSEFARRCTRKFAQKETPPAIFDGLAGVIRGLARKNILVIVTGNTAENVNAFLVHHGLQDCFRMVYGMEVPDSKTRKIQMAQKHFDVGHESIYFVGDSLSDMRAAREAGVKSVAVSWGHQDLHMLVGGRPDAVVHSPADLYAVLGSDG